MDSVKTNHQRRAAKVAREAIRTTMKPINKKFRKSTQKQTTSTVKRNNPKVPESNGSVNVNDSSKVAVRVHSRQPDNGNENESGSSAPVVDPVYDQLKQLPDKLLVQLPCGVIRDAAKHLKNVDYSALAGFIIFRTDLHPVIHLYLVFIKTKALSTFLSHIKRKR
uniref:Uncharacterized protein n=1 Tax=Setaria digitata TaxID=48799 RepID=A0A915Q0F8_9BILA